MLDLATKDERACELRGKVGSPVPKSRCVGNAGPVPTSRLHHTQHDALLRTDGGGSVVRPGARRAFERGLVEAHLTPRGSCHREQPDVAEHLMCTVVCSVWLIVWGGHRKLPDVTELVWGEGVS